VVTSEESSVVYVGNNSTTAPYPISFYFFRDEDLLVSTVDTLGSDAILDLNTDYIVTGAGNQNGGSLTTTFAVPIDWHLRIERIVEPTQLTSYQEGDAFPALSHERALDKLTFLVQQALRTGSSGSGGGGGRAWADDAERQLTTPNFIGQLGFQVNTATIYYAISTATGAWKKAIFDNLSATAGQLPIFSSDTHLTNIVIDGIATLTGGVLGATAKPAGDLVGTTQVQTLTNKTLESPVLNTPTGLDRTSVGLGNVDNTSDINKPVSNATQVSLDQKEDKANKGQLGGYAGLDATGKVPLQQMPQSVLGANVYQGTWNAATNTPAIPPAAIDNQGWYWVVSVAGSTNIDGISTWAPGDWIISNGTAWERVINIDSVSSVNTKTGAVVINKSDVGLGNVDNTSDATKNSAVATLTNKTLTSPVINGPTGLVKADVGLGNVDNTSDATKNAAVATLTNKTIDGANNTLRVRLDTTDVVNNLPVSHLNSGTGAGATTFWRGDGQWITPPGSGDVTGPAGAVSGELSIYANSTGKLLGRLAQVDSGRIAPGITLTEPILSVQSVPYRGSGMIHLNSADAPTSGTGEVTLYTYNLPAGLLARDGDCVRISTSLTGLTLAATRTMRFKWNGVTIFTHTATTGSTTIDGFRASHIFNVIRMSATMQAAFWQGTYNDGSSNAGFSDSEKSSLTATLTNSVPIVLTGQVSASGPLTGKYFMVEFLPAP
jgi:hypothetical protein